MSERHQEHGAIAMSVPMLPPVRTVLWHPL